MWTLDFETEAIVGNTTKYPPKPVGLAFRDYTGFTGYFTEWRDIEFLLNKVWNTEPLLFHNAKFDVAVAMHWFKLPYPKNPLNVHDTQFLFFLHDPHAPSLSLKPSAERILGLTPEEQDVVRDWVLRNVAGATKKDWGAHICKAPVEIVAPYAIGDVVRTFKLFEFLHPLIVSKGMEAAYQREQRLMPILMNAERRGIRVDVSGLDAECASMASALRQTDQFLFEALGSTFNPDSPAELANALDNAKVISKWVLTPKGARSTAKDALRVSVTSPEVLKLLLYRGGLDTCLNTFGLPWLGQAAGSEGRVHPNWNQVRQEGHGAAFKGTRTGRLSCDHPNLTNPPNEFIPEAPLGLPPIPKMRSFLLPEEGHVWVKRDFSSQEIRILAHYEDGDLMKAYQVDAKLDPHKMAQDLITKILGVELPRKDVKITAFSTIYGAGVSGLASQLECDHAKAKTIREAYMEAISGIRILGNQLRNRGRNGLPLRTWGGRLYLPEPPRLINNVMRSFEYKLLNYLIQGSAADQTKQTIIDWDAGADNSCLFLAALHDEINISAPGYMAVEAMRYLKTVMNHPRFDVPMLSEGFIGDNFGDLHVVES